MNLKIKYLYGHAEVFNINTVMKTWTSSLLKLGLTTRNLQVNFGEFFVTAILL